MIIELHCHTNCSDGLPSPEQVIKYAKTRLDAIAVTDHNTFSGYQKAKKYAKKDIIVVPGREISTDNGHVLCYGLEELKFKKYGSAAETIDDIHSSGGIAVFAHPFRAYGHHVKNHALLKKVDAIEVLNGNTIMHYNQKTFNAARLLHKPMTAGSDAHRLKDVGTYACNVNATSIDAILCAIKKGKIKLPAKNVTMLSIAEKFIGRRTAKITGRVS